MYKFPSLRFKLIVAPSPLAFLSSTKRDTNFHMWHDRLGRPSPTIVSRVLKSYNLPFSIDTSLCPSCCLGKFHQLPFSYLIYVYNKPLELVYTDIWGPPPIPSINGAHYYIHFIDAFSKHTWIYLVNSKSRDLFSYISNKWLNCNLILKLSIYKEIIPWNMLACLNICRPVALCITSLSLIHISRMAL